MPSQPRAEIQEIYQSKRVTAEQAVAKIGAGEDIAMGMALGEPPGLLAALASRLRSSPLSGLKLWYFHSMLGAAQTVLSYDLMDQIAPHCMFLGPTERALQDIALKEGRRVINFVPVAFSDAPRLLSQDVNIGTFLTTVSPMDRHGYFSFAANNDYASAAARSAQRTIVEVNESLPRVFGDSMLHISEVDAVVEHHAELFEMPVRPVTDEESEISRSIAAMIDDGACLQMGIGALPNAVCDFLSDRSDLGIHTELLGPGLARLVRGGAVTNRRKQTFPGRSVFTFALGDRDLYDLIDNNPAFNSYPVNLVNDPRHIAKNDNVVSVNSTLEIDLFGACNSENVNGRQYSGSGGQLDFVRGARASVGGKSIIACPSTAKDGAISRIVPMLSGSVTTPRNDVDTVVTEYGVARLIGLSGVERAKAMISLAHPDHRADLQQAARRIGLI
ncbi:MAG: acetyl-CoA hydrolase/transferase family protein [Henriciella sp.]